MSTVDQQPQSGEGLALPQEPPPDVPATRGQRPATSDQPTLALPDPAAAPTLTPGAGDLPPGSILGAYRIEGRLGEGGMGVVLKAAHQVLNRPAALKVMRPELAADRQYADRFLREARAAAAVSHQNLVAIYDAGELAGRTWLASEFAPGGDLDALLAKQGPLSAVRALEVVAGCADGLQALHEAGLVHRDIKPHNIFLDPRGRPKLGDFGLARDAGGADRLTMTGVGMGTPAYMAPEQAQGDPRIDIRADIHALGGTLFTLLTKRTPYTGPTAWAVVNAVVNEPVPDLRALRPELPAEVAAICAKSLAKRREDRFQTPAELAAACRAALARLAGGSAAALGQPLLAPAGDSGFLGPFAGSGWLWLLGTAIVLLLLPLGLNPLCELTPVWRGPGYAQPGLYGAWLGFTAVAAALLWMPLRLARGEQVGRGGLLTATVLTAIVAGALLWFAWAALLDAGEAGRGWRPVAGITTTAAGLAWLVWWGRRAWARDHAVLAAQLMRLAQIAIPLLVAVLIGHLIAASGAKSDDSNGFLTNLSRDRILGRHPDAEAAWALDFAVPLALAVIAPLLRLRLAGR